MILNLVQTFLEDDETKDAYCADCGAIYTESGYKDCPAEFDITDGACVRFSEYKRIVKLLNDTRQDVLGLVAPL